MPYLVVKNLGNIKKASIRLTDFIIFVGKNNTNKTWLAYLIHAIADERNIFEFSRFQIWKYPSLERKIYSLNREYIRLIKPKILKEKKDLKNIPIIKEEHIPFLKELLKRYLKYIERKFPEFLSFKGDAFQNLRIYFKWYKNEMKKLLPTINMNIYAYTKDLLETFHNNERLKTFLIPFYSRFFPAILLKSIIRIILGRPFNLPVERNALITFSNLITLGESSINKEEFRKLYEIMFELEDLLTDLNKKKDLKDRFYRKVKYISDNLKEVFSIFLTDFHYSYPIPIKDFKNFVARLSSLQEKENKLNLKILQYMAKIIEGKIYIKNEGFFYEPIESKLNFPLIVSSSMVKSLGGLYVYILYKAERGDFLIIDEPENNLHPQAQVKLIELLSIMVNNGIKILITTHSPYIVDHLINLIEAAKSPFQRRDIISKFYLQTEEAFIKPEKVAAYFFKEDGIVENIFKNDFIDWETFSKVSEEIAQLYYDIQENNTNED